MLGSFSNAAAINSEDGTFAIEVPRTGTVDVVVAGRGFARRVIPGIVIEEGRETNLGDVTVARGITIEGVVTDDRGRALQGAEVRVQGNTEISPAADELTEFARGVHTTTTDDTGTYKMSGIGNLDPSMPLFVFSVVPNLGATGPYPITMTDSKVDLVVRPTGSLGGLVIGPTNRDRSREIIVAQPDFYPQMSLSCVPDKNGRFRLEHVPEGSYRVTLMIAGMPSRDVNVRRGQLSNVTFNAP